MGRKVLYPNRKQVTVTLTSQEKEAIRIKALSNGTDVSKYIRSMIIDNIAA